MSPGRVGTEYAVRNDHEVAGSSLRASSHTSRTQRLQNVVLFLRNAVSRNESVVEALYGESNPQEKVDEPRPISCPLRDIDLAIEEIESLANRIDCIASRVHEAFFNEGD